MTGAYVPVATTAENYGPFPRLDYRYEAGVTAVIGPNGVGKSFLVNAPAVALFGHTPDGVSFSELLSNTGADRMVVCHEFEANGERYRVRRSFSSRGGGKSTLDLEHNWTGDGEEPWTPQTRASIRETQDWITGLLGMTKETFLASALQVQNEASFASRATSRTERCDLLMAGLRLGDYERLRGLAERDRKQAEAEAARLAVRLEQAEQELLGMGPVNAGLLKAQAIERDATSWLSDAEGKVEYFLDQQRQAEQQASERRAAEAELREAETARLRLREQAAAADIARDQIEAARETLARLATPEQASRATIAYQNARDTYLHAQRERDALRSRFASLEHDERCPTCLRPYDDHEQWKRDYAAAAAALDAHQMPPAADETESLRLREQVTERARLEERIAAWQQTIDNAPDENALLQASIVSQKAKDVVTLLPLIDQAECDRIKQQTLKARAQVTEQRQRLDQARQEKARLEAQLERLQQVEEQAMKMRIDLDLNQCLAGFSARMETMYGRDGIPALVIESVAVPYLEQQATDILHRLGKAWTVEIHLGKETKKGDVRPALDVKAVTETGAVQRYEMCSGGEQMRLDIALHVAFVRLWKQRNGSWSELYALDEPEGLDADGMAALVEVLDFLGEEFGVVQLVSHHSELRDSIGQVAMVSRNGRGSTVGVPA